MPDREKSLKKVVEYIKKQDDPVSVKEISEAVDLSTNYVRELAKEAMNRGLIQGQKNKPVIGYIFNDRGRARADGGDPDGDLRVLTTREALLQAVKDYAPHRFDEASSKSLEDLREFVRDHVADATVPVSHAWEFYGE